MNNSVKSVVKLSTTREEGSADLQGDSTIPTVLLVPDALWIPRSGSLGRVVMTAVSNEPGVFSIHAHGLFLHLF